ncbi:hypothetical protein B0H21DRAFT_522767 [Amylocystis lapponica]|nr:hypothetical protein B0H21DRAFT_522767 [Amylocystis lapponica]
MWLNPSMPSTRLHHVILPPPSDSVNLIHALDTPYASLQVLCHAGIHPTTGLRLADPRSIVGEAMIAVENSGLAFMVSSSRCDYLLRVGPRFTVDFQRRISWESSPGCLRVPEFLMGARACLLLSLLLTPDNAPQRASARLASGTSVLCSRWRTQFSDVASISIALDTLTGLWGGPGRGECTSKRGREDQTERRRILVAGGTAAKA